MPRREKQPLVRVMFPRWRERKAYKAWAARRAHLTDMLERDDLDMIGYRQALRQAAQEYDDALTFVC